MKRIANLIGSAALLCTVTLFLLGSSSNRNKSINAEKKEIKKLAKADDIFLPEKIYAVPGVECNIYFRNIFFAVNHANYIFDVDCKAGRQEIKRWSFTPKDKDAGQSYPLTVKVYDEKGLVAECSTTILVASRMAGKEKDLSILIVGDSLTNASIYPGQLLALCKKYNAPKLTMIGSHAGGGKKPVPGGVAHEGYGGWSWPTFLYAYNKKSKSHRAKSKFLVEQKNGKRVFSLTEYVKKYNNGKMPDVVTFQLGVNDIFSAKEDNLHKRIPEVLANAHKLISAFRKEAPNALFGVGFVTGGASQDAFGNNYGCGQTSFAYYRNHFRLNQAMAKYFASYKDPKLVMIPSHVNLDTENNFPSGLEIANLQNSAKIKRQRNGVHPAATGYRQMGDSFYAWLKYQLEKGFLAAKQK